MAISLLEVRDSIVRSLTEQSEYWYAERVNASDGQADAAWLYKARDRVYWAVAQALRGLNLSQATAPQAFYEAILNAVDGCDVLQATEHWPDELLDKVRREVRLHIETSVPAEFQRTHERAMSGRRNIRLFMSFSAKDRAIVDRIGQAVERTGVRVSYDVSGAAIPFGEQARPGESAFLCVVLSRTSVATGWVQMDIRKAVEEDGGKRMRLVAIRLDDCQEPSYFARLRQPVLSLEMSDPEGIEKLAGVITSVLDRSRL